MPAPGRATLVVASIALALGVAACNDDGRTLAPASSLPPITPPATATTDRVADLTLTSPVFEDGAPLDPDFTCDGLDVPPPLIVSGVPQGTAELAIVMRDLDADGYVHWVVAGIPSVTRRIETGVLPPGAVVAENDAGIAGWSGPCPPPGDPQHRYEFTVYATAEPIGLVADQPADQAVATIEAAAVASDSIVAVY